MFDSEIIAVCSQIQIKHINTLWVQNVVLLNVKPGGTYSDHWALKWRAFPVVPFNPIAYTNWLKPSAE
jgi:hypothetical protein